MQFVKKALKAEMTDKAEQLTLLLDGATTTPEIREAMPKCGDFFKSLTSDEFVELLSKHSTRDPVYTALWYHYGKTMRKAVDECALAGKSRMMMLYPLWRLYADEADSYE